MPSRRSGAPLAVALVAAAVLLALLFAWWGTRAPSPRDAAAPPPGAAPRAAAPERGRPPPPSRLPIRVAPLAPAPPDAVPASFEGRVVSSAGGAPVAGADLTFSRAGAAASVRADAEGSFLFQPPAEGRWLLATVTAPGFLPFAPEWGHSPVQLDARAGQHVRGIEIHLVPAIEITGRVVDPEGRPVAGAEVRLVGAVAEATLVPIRDRFTSDAGGEFRFASPEGASLVARKEGFLPGRADVDWVAISNGRVTVALRAGERAARTPLPIEGRVVARGGAPVPGALVVASADAWGYEGPSAQAVADEDGRFTLADLDRGRYRVTARAEGRAPASARRVRPGTRDLVLELGEGGRLRGCVRDAATGAPVAPFTVVVMERRSALRLVPQRSRSVIDARGCYALDDLLPGPASVLVSAPGYAPSPELQVEIPPPGGEAVADAALRAGGRVEGLVRDEATGAPIAGARLSVEGAFSAASTFPVLSEAVSGADGRFTLPHLPPRVSIMAAAAGHHARIVGVDVPEGGAASVEIPLRPAGEGEEPRIDLAGIGAVLTAHGDGLSVAQTAPGGGAAEVGLGRGDLILRVNGQPVTELGFGGAIDAIRGPEGTGVVLTVRRGESTFDVSVPRRVVRG
jgi:hypothetical protein